ncbi:hypothetical protein C8J57DRAFT_1237054 [Mycena rebaudengoi]|nr:hypothetical protein C8J57DRAFT_1237054 [Mycena rebaudengoi]
MFNYHTLFSIAFTASSMMAGEIVPISVRAPLASCNITAIQETLVQQQADAQAILHVGLMSPDPFRENANRNSLAKLETVVTAINDAATAAAAGDFATVASKGGFLSRTRGQRVGEGPRYMNG